MQKTQPKPFVFVLMPFSREFDDIYRLGIKPACSNAGAYAERVDEQVFQDSILQRIYNQIAKADLVIADMSGKNANVFYETGYAHALGKSVVLLAQSADDIPFDLKHYPHVIYGGRIVDLLPELEKRVRYLLEAPPGAPTLVTPVEARANGAKLPAVEPLDLRVATGSTQFEVKVELHNSVDREIRQVEGQLGLVAPRHVTSANVYTVTIDEHSLLHLRPNRFEILPGSWYIASFILFVEPSIINSATSHHFVVRLFTASGVYDFPFVGRVTR